MLKLLERDIAAADTRLHLLAPPNGSIPDAFSKITANRRRHAELLRDIQRLRGSVYLDDGAITKQQLSSDGRHRTPEDEKSWHLVVVDEDQRVTGCIWYLEHERPALERLRVNHCPLAHSAEWRHALRSAVEADIAQTRREGIRYAEVGGWAVAPGSRGTSEGLLLALGAYSLSQLTGGALVITTATARHCSSTMLRRIGGSLLEGNGCTLPAYYDPRYKCDMELLRFDSRRPSTRYAGLIESLKYSLSNAQVIDSRVEIEVPSTFIYGQQLPQPQFAA
jgi:hypothetical protein